MTRTLFRDDPYLRQAPGQVTAVSEMGLILDQSLFYPTGGGQPGDTGQLSWSGGTLYVTGTVKSGTSDILLQIAPGSDLPPVGVEVIQTIDWARRFAHMRTHTALHLLSVVVPLPVTGGAIGAGQGRLDFLMPEPPTDLAALEAAINAHVARDLAVTTEWITEAELDANPGLVKTMSVAPPRGAGRIRLVRIGDDHVTLDLQPCGGTHVARTGEIGRIRIGKPENKGRQNRRLPITLDQPG